MKINRLQLVNFRQHADSLFEFEGGLTGIIGPNGSGKSTVLEAIAWALYGNAAARGTRDSIRFSRAPARSSVRVELGFELGAHRFRVVRGLTSAELYLDDSAEPIANSITAVGDLLQRRLGMTRSEFFNTYFTGQKELDVMAAMGPTERAQFLSRVLGYERLRTAQALVRDRRKVIAAEIAVLREGLPDPAVVARQLQEADDRRRAADRRLAVAEEAFAGASRALAAVAPQWTRAQAERERAQQAETERRVGQGEEAALSRDVARLARDLHEVAAARAELEALATELAPLPGLMVEIQQFNALAGEEGRRRTLLAEERVLADELARLRDRRERVSTAPALEEEATVQLEQKRHAVEAMLAELEARRTEWVRDRQEAETRREALLKQWRDAKEQRDRIVALGEEGTCPTCARPLGDHYRQVLDVLDAQLETVMVDGNFFKRRLEQLQEVPEEVRALDEQRRALALEAGAQERRLAKVQSAVQELAQLGRDIHAKEERHAGLRRDIDSLPAGYDTARHAAVRREIERLTPLDARQARLGAQVDREPQLLRERDRVTAHLMAVRGRMAALAAGIGAPLLGDAEYAALRARHEEAQQAARTAELDAVAARGEAEAARVEAARAAQAQAELAAAQQRLAVRQGEKRLHDELDRAFSDVRTDLNAQLRPELSEIASQFLSELTDARYGELELNEDYALSVREDGVPKPVISGGEEDLANLVLRLAISQMIAERSGQSFSLLILDEVFGSLDESRRQHVLELLRSLHHRFEQVIVITHIEGVRDGLDRVISVRYNEETGASDVTRGEAITAPDDDAGAELAGLGAA
ncbi:MAG: SMC family ATPase [Gemmatimonadetes bacterium]|nr:SMC family ATPase [Gemmatimonadota bacterium]